MNAGHTPGPWEWADVPGAGLQIRGPYKDGTRLMFSDIWRQFPDREWDATMVANTKLATSAPDLLAERDRLKAANAELFNALNVLIDVWDDSETHPDYRVYIEGAWKAVIGDARAALTKHNESEA